MCERKARREEKHKTDIKRNEILKKEKMHINNENMKYENVGLQGATTDTI